MDLGYGSANQRVGNAVAASLQQLAKAQENALDDELAQYDALLEDSATLDRLRQSRLESLKEEQRQRQKWQTLGHGEYQCLNETSSAGTSDVAKAFFDIAKQSERVVVHFFRPSKTMSLEYTQLVHKALHQVAKQHLETRFVSINVQDASKHNGIQYLVEKLGIVMLPTLVLVKELKAVHHIRGLDEIGGEQVSAKRLQHALFQHGLVFERDDICMDPEYQDDDEDDTDNYRKGVNSIRLRR